MTNLVVNRQASMTVQGAERLIWPFKRSDAGDGRFIMKRTRPGVDGDWFRVTSVAPRTADEIRRHKQGVAEFAKAYGLTGDVIGTRPQLSMRALAQLVKQAESARASPNLEMTTGAPTAQLAHEGLSAQGRAFKLETSGSVDADAFVALIDSTVAIIKADPKLYDAVVSNGRVQADLVFGLLGMSRENQDSLTRVYFIDYVAQALGCDVAPPIQAEAPRTAQTLEIIHKGPRLAALQDALRHSDLRNNSGINLNLKAIFARADLRPDEEIRALNPCIEAVNCELSVRFEGASRAERREYADKTDKVKTSYSKHVFNSEAFKRSIKGQRYYAIAKEDPRPLTKASGKAKSSLATQEGAAAPDEVWVSRSMPSDLACLRQAVYSNAIFKVAASAAKMVCEKMEECGLFANYDVEEHDVILKSQEYFRKELMASQEAKFTKLSGVAPLTVGALNELATIADKLIATYIEDFIGSDKLKLAHPASTPSNGDVRQGEASAPPLAPLQPTSAPHSSQSQAPSIATTTILSQPRGARPRIAPKPGDPAPITRPARPVASSSLLAKDAPQPAAETLSARANRLRQETAELGTALQQAHNQGQLDERRQDLVGKAALVLAELSSLAASRGATVTKDGFYNVVLRNLDQKRAAAIRTELERIKFFERTPQLQSA